MGVSHAIQELIYRFRVVVGLRLGIPEWKSLVNQPESY